MKVPYFTEEKIKVGIYGFTGCAGDQLVIIHDEDRLVEYFTGADIRSFVMASSLSDEECELDIAIVEGAIHTDHEVQELMKIRERAKILVAIGNCAMHGGMQSGLHGDGKWEERFKAVYGETIMLTPAFEPQPLSHFVKVDATIPGCPIDKDQVYEAFARLVHGLPPELRIQPVCETCKQKENICLLDKGILCLGPITADGCKAACPSNNLPCMGCYGIYEGANIPGFMAKGKELGYSQDKIISLMRTHGGATINKKLRELELL